MKKNIRLLSSFIVFAVFGLFYIFSKPKDLGLVVLDMSSKESESVIDKPQIDSLKIIANQGLKVIDQNDSRKFAAVVESPTRLIDVKGHEKTGQLKMQIRQNMTSEKIKSQILKYDSARVGDVVLSYDFKAEILGQETSSNFLGAYNNFLVLKDSGRILGKGQFYVVFDEEKNTAGFATGRFIVETNPDFDVKDLEKINMKISEDSPESEVLFFIEHTNDDRDFYKSKNQLSEFKGVRSVRLEIIYNFMKQQ